MHRNKIAWLVLIIAIVAIKTFSLFPAAVEKYYSTAFYPWFSRLLRLLFGWIPFSIGDILYLAAGLFLLYKFVRFLAVLFTGRADKTYWWSGIRWVIYYCMLVYCVFNIFWGLNYNRLGMAAQMRLDMKPYSTTELADVTRVLISRLDTFTVAADGKRSVYLRKRPLFDTAYDSYRMAASRYPHLDYTVQSVKTSLYKYPGDYLGYMGYYNPFTGEAQVNNTVPVFVRPFTTCHEMGHQLGYAKENEANFAGYLSAKSSTDPVFRYSVYFDLYNYAIRELYFRDSVLAKNLNKEKPLQVKTDIITLRNFFKAYENPVEPYIRKLYGDYLKANEQPEGMHSYNEVMAFLVAYYNKFGAAAL